MMKRGLKSHGASLIELLVVLFIIAIMLGLLLPALQSARNRALTVQCQNNVRQLGFALQRFMGTKKRLPAYEHWTIDVLKYMEEDALADALANGIPNNGHVARPKLFQCPNQSEVDTTIQGVPMCHYVFVVDRPNFVANPDRLSWEIIDREELSDSDAPTIRPWFVGPEMTFKQEATMFATKRGPHAGLYYDSAGQTRGGP
jgi:type II secretory pathway pseudopilin PulG